MTNALSIPGNAGPIEAMVSVVDGDRGAVLCHPHPLYGGSMFDAVVDAIHDGCRRAGLSTLRFNFRGVGASAGEHDGGSGETEDAAGVAAWFRGEHDFSAVMLGGYSFGAGIALLAASSASPDALVLVAPPVQMLERAKIPGEPILVLLGRNDRIVDCGAAGSHFSGCGNVQVEVVEGSDHFFIGAHEEIAERVERFIRGT